MGKYKLTDKKRNGFKAFPKALVEGIFWDKVKQKLSDVLENLQSRVTALEEGGSGGGGGSSDVSSVIQTDGSLWNVDGTSGVITTSKAEAAALLGVSEEIFDGIVAGNDARNLSIPNETTGEVLMVYLAGYYKQPDDYIGGTLTSIMYTESINYKNVMLYVSAPAEGDASYNIFGLNLDGE